MHHFTIRHLPRPSHHDSLRRTFYKAAAGVSTSDDSTAISSINWVRDRALDHAVEKERDLKPMLNLKNLIISEPSKSLPLSIISDNKQSIGIPIRPIEFLRKYPSIFQQFFPGGIGIHPHVKLTPEILALDAEEQLFLQSEIHKQDVANRLLKLLMIARINKIPLCIIDRLKWDLGLPLDYTQSIVPQFPDYFQVTSNGNELELVCWSDELAVSAMEKRSVTVFPLQYSRGFTIDKKFKKWVDDWQKLPYVSPYVNALDLPAKSDESDRWAVALLHEILHLLVPKKTEKDNLLILGEYLGVRSRFKRALLQHPGIFYISSKLHTHTVVLREAYKRDLLVEKPHPPLMAFRSKHIHLMTTVKEQNKQKNAQVDGSQKQEATENSDEEHSEQEEDEALSSLSDSELEVVTDDQSNNDTIEAKRPIRQMKYQGQAPSEHAKIKSFRKVRRGNDDYSDRDEVSNGNGRGRGSTKFNKNSNLGITKRSDTRTRETKPPRFLRTEVRGARNGGGRSSERSGVSRTRARQF